jgi:hypothetical protein
LILFKTALAHLVTKEAQKYFIFTKRSIQLIGAS